MNLADRCPRQLPAGDLWVFAYGSLMWNPGFRYAEARVARVHGYHRALCILSVVHRGTRHRPGLVFGLDAGGACVGMAFRVSADLSRSTVDYLMERELVTDVYRPRTLRAYLNNRPVEALAFVADRGHWQYAGRPSVQEAAERIASASGRSGANRDYVTQTLARLEEIGIRDSHLCGIRSELNAARIA